MDFSALFFQDFAGIVRTLVVGTLAYVVLVIFLRISGKRTLAKLNAFDLVVTVAIGSTLATVLLSKTVALGSTLSAILLQKSIPLAEGATALALLICLQALVTLLSVRSSRFAGLVRSEPTLLARDGQFCTAAMRRERVTQDEVLGTVRSSGGRDITDVDFMVLESDGSISVRLRA